jgi:hypothetical protein
MAGASRGRWLTTAAVLFGILAVSNLLKPLFADDRTGFVFLGQRLSGTANAVMGPLFGIFLALYAAGIWGMKRFALPMSYAYAAYVALNVLLFPFRTPPHPGAGVAETIFGVVYAVLAIGFSAGTARVLARRADELS